jgi:ABC-type ATPase with predicted acetyltransferase domain
MNLSTSRFTISTMAVAVCAMLALVAAETAQAQAARTVESPVQRIEIVGQRLPVQRIEIVGQRQRPEARTAAATNKTLAL